MRVREALEQIDAIHEYLARAEVYRGFRTPGVALVGVIGIAAAAIQPRLAPATPAGFVWYWLAVAALALAVGGGTAVHAYLFQEDEFARRRTRRVLTQFLPCLLAGLLTTAAFVRAGSDLILHLPGTWAILFGLGIIAARPYLPRGIGLVGLGYVLAGGVLLARAPLDGELSGWTVGGVFGVGHFATAIVLWCDEPRSEE